MATLRPRWALTAILWFAFLQSDCAHRQTGEVFAIRRTMTYHRAECPPVHMAKVTVMTVEQAQLQHFRPCPNCQSNSK
jgi:methylphosphotriester-DNA--protein-cysteine methyltransferase